MKNPIVIGTRGSDLALWQAHHVKAQLEALGLPCIIHIITTKGDTIQHLSFDKIEGKGFFTKEIEDALLSNEIDLAVHSHKDLETTMPEGLIIAAVSARAGTGDLLLVRKDKVAQGEKYEVTKDAVVGTSSSRRKALMLHHRPDVSLKDIRGNVPTRIQKLRNGEFDAILLADAGVDRLELDLSDLHVVRLSAEEFVPAPAQGVLAIQCRSADTELSAALSKIDDQASRELVTIERKVLNLMQGGCHLPLGVYAVKEEDEFEVHVAFATEWNAPLRNITFTSDNKDVLPEIIVGELKKAN